MNRNLQQLFNIAQKTERLAIGLMSGTSLDGLDIALCRFSGNGRATRFTLLHFTTIPSPPKPSPRERALEKMIGLI